MIRFNDVTVTFDGQVRPALSRVSLEVPEGELCLVVGVTGSGKSTLLQCINGLVPWFTGGTLHGRVTVAGRDTAEHPPRQMADLVGFAGQVPAAGFVASTVDDELAYTMENLGVPPAVMRRRVEEIVDLLGLERVRHRALATLSSGEQQRVAIGAVLTASPRVLVLDEPTSALDPGASEDVLAAITRLVHDLGLTVVMAEHRLERVVQYADHVVVVDGGLVRDGNPVAMMHAAEAVPPVVELGRVAGWDPLPLSVRDARRHADALRVRIGSGPPPARIASGAGGAGLPAAIHQRIVARVHAMTVRYGADVAVRDASFTISTGEIVALMGRNGAGKSTVLNHLAGVRKPAAGRVEIGGAAPHTLRPRDLVARVALVPPDPARLLYATTVACECEEADREGGLPAGTTARAVHRLLDDVDSARHPRDLSEGQRLALVLGIVLAPEPDLILLDEPTRGLDYAAKQRLTASLRNLALQGHAVIIATHDVELVAEVATRVIVLADGEIVADSAVRDAITASTMFAPQVAKILQPATWLTVGEVKAALGA